MKKIIEWFNWCRQKEEQIIDRLDESRYVIEFLENLANETTNKFDNFLVNLLKKRLEKKNKNR